MNWIDKPVDRLCKSHDLLKARDRMRKRRLLLRENAMDRPVKVPPTTVLQDWFTDEHGCRARQLGNREQA